MARTHCDGDQSAAAGAEHETHAAQDDQHGHNKIDGCEGCFSYKIGDEKSINDTVDGSKDQHDNGWGRKT